MIQAFGYSLTVYIIRSIRNDSFHHLLSFPILLVSIFNTFPDVGSVLAPYHSSIPTLYMYYMIVLIAWAKVDLTVTLSKGN